MTPEPWGQSERRTAVLLALVVTSVVLTGTAALPLAVGAQSSGGVPVEYVNSASGYETATADGWAGVQTATVALGSSGAAVPNANDIAIESVRVGAVRTDRRVYLRTSWDDPSADTTESSVQAFADSVAVQFPATRGEAPPIAMGSREDRVNVWLWSANGRTEELLAGGPGTTTAFPEDTLTVDQTYENGTWHVLFSRPLDPNGEARTTIPTKSADLSVAFAVWDGANMERSGQKAVSQWQRLAVSPGAPPYQTVLWAVAGVMIVFTTLVTIAGIRRTRGEE
jgi:DMSO reductase family type II enzyme heme b subunit